MTKAIEGLRVLPETPLPSPSGEKVWGSDAIAAMLHALELPYIALNPGASFRGLHDSLVNYAGNREHAAGERGRWASNLDFLTCRLR